MAALANQKCRPVAPPQPKRLTILGATGSIGQSTLKLVDHHPEAFILDTLTAMNSIDELITLAKAYVPKQVVIGNEEHYKTLKDALAGTGINVAAGEAALCEAAARPVDVVLSAIVGSAGLKPTLSAIKTGNTVALANKESLVVAGEIMMREAAANNVGILPVDSEHSAIFQVLNQKDRPHVSKVTLTASGGPFRGWSLERMAEATPEQAVNHPNWSMGAKISVDSATMMNKGLELIEAHHLFALTPDQLDIIIHPESIVHCLVEHVDGSVLAQLCNPDMCTPIACALAWPQRMAAPVAPLNLAEIGALHFEAPDERRFPALALTKQALAAGQAATAALNAANEVAVAAFLAGEVKFLDIAAIVERTLGDMTWAPVNSVDDALAVDEQARRKTREHLRKAMK